MFVLTTLIHRNGAVCREYYQPDPEKSDLPGIVFGSLLAGQGKECAKQYATKEEAEADIPNWIEATRQRLNTPGHGIVDVDVNDEFEADMRGSITIDEV